MDKMVRRNDGYSPVWGLSNLHRDLDGLFETFFSPTGAARAGAFHPACDFEETPTHFLATFDLGGVKKEDIQVEVKENQLHVFGEKREEKKTTEGKRHLSERSYGSFERWFTFPTAVDSDKVEATFKDGVLDVKVPKSEKAKGRKISIG